LLFQHTSLLLYTYFADVAVVVLLEMLFEKGCGGKFLINFAGLAVGLDEALEFVQLLEGVPAFFRAEEDICEVLIGEEVDLEALEGLELGHDDDVLERELNGRADTLQIGHWLFLLITRIL
jgi:hypothetical protein